MHESARVCASSGFTVSSTRGAERLTARPRAMRPLLESQPKSASTAGALLTWPPGGRVHVDCRLHWGSSRKSHKGRTERNAIGKSLNTRRECRCFGKSGQKEREGNDAEEASCCAPACLYIHWFGETEKSLVTTPVSRLIE